MRVIWTQFGYTSPEDLLSHLAIEMERNQPALVEEQASRDQRVVDAAIREEQDAAFEASLQEDRRKCCC